MILLPLLTAMVACWPSFLALHGMWMDWQLTTYTHGYLIVAICAWLLWRNRETLQSLPATGHWVQVLPLLMSGLLWLFAVQSGIRFVELALLPVVLWSAVLSACGWPTARRVTFPIVYLYFATPLPNILNGFFQWTSVYSVRFALRAYGVPAYFDANHVQISEGTFEIAEGCSGLHFVIVASAIALLVSELRRDSWSGRVKLLFLAVTLAMMTNWVRIFTIILAGHYSHMQHYLVARSHYGFGWGVFAVAMTIFFLVERRMPLTPRSAPAHSGIRTDSAAFRIGWQLPTLAVLAIVAAWQLAASRPAMAHLAVTSPPPGWIKQVSGPNAWQPRFDGIDEQSVEQFSRQGTVVQRYRGLYLQQKQGKELDGYNNDSLGGLYRVEESAAVPEYLPAVIRTRDAAGNSSLISIKYRIGSKHFRNALKGKLWYAMRSLLALRSSPSNVEVLRTDCAADCSKAATSLQEFEEQQ